VNAVLSLSAIILYLAAAAYRLSYLIGNKILISKHFLLLLGIVAVLLHAVVLYQHLIVPAGLNLGFFNAVSLVSWAIALLLILVLPHRPVENLVVVLFPVAALAIGLASYFQVEHILTADKGWGVKLHVFSSILAYSLLNLSALQAIFLAIQDYQLHHKRVGWVIQRLPPLQTMENLFFQLIALGFFILSLSLISGIVFLEDILAQHLVHKTVLSLIAWGVFATLLWGHWHYGWRGRTAIGWGLGGIFFLMLAYFGSKLVLELILKHPI
jgi:ABC-type uncharacterized transport system permease subunit